MPNRLDLPKRWKTLRFLSAPEVAFDHRKKIEKSLSISLQYDNRISNKSFVFHCVFNHFHIQNNKEEGDIEEVKEKQEMHSRL